MDINGEEQKISRETVKLVKSFGFEGSKRNNISYIAPNILIHSCGDIVHFLDLRTNISTFQASVEGNGIGCVAVHPKRTHYAVCEKGVSPNIYIYSYPALEIYKTLVEGTERFFTAASYNSDGDQLATVGAHPDYLLTVWDWENELMILRTKAFSQEVFNVDFSRYFKGQLLTSGVGHVRFWKMASTFTGLKLEGAIAKFGTVPISDIAAYYELKNSKVLTGTELGTILVWDDSLIKCQLKRPGDGVMCHDGMIEWILLEEDAGKLTSAGQDGYIRTWNLDWLEAANDGDDKLVCEILPTKEVQVDPECQIKRIICEKDHWIIQDEGGALWRSEFPSFKMKKLLEFHAGPIAGVTSSPFNYDIASAGSDGTVRLYNFKKEGALYKRKFNAACTVIRWLPLTIDRTGQSVVVGFKDGVVRVLTHTKDHWRLSVAAKPHKLNVTALGWTQDGQMLASVSGDGSIFYFHCANSFRPLGYTMVPGPITCMDWSHDGLKLLVGCSNGVIMEVGCPRTDIDTSKSFILNDLVKTPFNFKRPPIAKKIAPLPPSPPEEVKVQSEAPKEGKAQEGGETSKEGEVPKEGEALKEGETPKEGEAPKEGEEAKLVGEAPIESLEDIPPKPPTPPPPPPEPIELEDPPGTVYPIRAILYTNGKMNSFYIATEGLASGYIFECHVDSIESMGYIEWSKKPISCIRYTESTKYIVSGSDNGVVRIQEHIIPGQIQLGSKYWEAGLHDGFYGVVTGATFSFDDQFLASVSKDGSFFIHNIGFVTEKLEPPKATSPKDVEGDVTDVAANMLSIEEQRAKVEQDEINRLALEAKVGVMSKVNDIRTSLSNLLKLNKETERNKQLQPKDFVIDHRIEGMLKAETLAEVQQARNELQWDSEKKNVALRKLFGFFLDPLEVEYIVLHAFVSGTYTTTFRTPKLSPQFQVFFANAQREGWLGRRASVPRDKSNQGEKDFLQDDKPKKKEKIERADEPGITKLEYRRRLLKQRAREWIALLATKPDLTWVTDEDAENIEWAKMNRGDFKLKSNKDYIVPDDKYTNAYLKRNEIVLFGEAVYKTKMVYNKTFLALREKKMLLLKNLRMLQGRIANINKKISSDDPLIPLPDMQKDEQPETRVEITKEEQKIHLDKLAAEAAATAAAESKAKEGGGLGGMGAGPKPKDVKQVEPEIEQVTVQEKVAPVRGLKRKVEVVAKIVFSPLEEVEKESTNIRLQFEKSQLEVEMMNKITAFDVELEDLRVTKYRLEICMKCADIKTLTLYQELKVLRVLQPTEEALDFRHREKLAAETTMLFALGEHEKVVDANKDLVQTFIDARQNLYTQWEAMNLPLEVNAAHDVLHRMYTKKMRRPKKKKEGAGDDDDSDDSDMDVEADEDEDEYEDEDFVEECPPKANPILYQKMVALRDQRCELDYQILDQNKVIDLLLKEKGTFIKKTNALKTQVKAIETEIRKFQTLKQTSLNNVEIALTILLSQIEYMDDEYSVPRDLFGGLIFTSGQLQSLKDQIETHGQQIVSWRQLHKELHKEHTNLNKERWLQEKKTWDTENKYMEVQLLKFGQPISDETLDIISIKKDLNFLKDRVRNQEVEFTHDLTLWMWRSEAATNQLRLLTKENAAIYHIIADIKEKMNNINFDLKHRAGSAYVDPLLEKRKAEADQKILCQLITQNDEIINKLQNDTIKLKTVLPNIFPCD